MDKFKIEIIDKEGFIITDGNYPIINCDVMRPNKKNGRRFSQNSSGLYE